MRLALVALVVACAGLWACATPTGNFYEDVVAKRERINLRDHASVAARRGPQLELKLAPGKSMRFTDSGDCENPEQCVEYGLYDYDAGNRIFVVWRQYYESGGVTMVDQRTGAFLELDNVPHVSPSGKYWLIANSNIADGDGDVVIVKRGEKDFKARVIFASRFCEFDRWIDDASFRAYCSKPDGANFNFDLWQETIVQRDKMDQWTASVTDKTFSYDEINRPFPIE